MKKEITWKKYLARHWELYALLLVPVILLLLFSYYPMLGVQIAFKRFNLVEGVWGSPWAGLYQFDRFFRMPNFWKILWNTVSLSVYTLVAGFPVPIILALLLNAFPKQRYKNVIQTVTYIPYFFSVVVMIGMVIQLMNPRTGAIGTLYTLLSGGNYMSDALAKPAAFPHVYVWSGIWQNMGYNSIVYLAALSGVDMEQHEAAEVDGATRLQRVWHIDLPAIVPTATILLIMQAGRIMTVGFEKVFLLQNSLNIGVSEVISTYVYKVGLTIGSGDFSFATAIGLFNSIINLVILISVNAATKKLNDTSLW